MKMPTRCSCFLCVSNACMTISKPYYNFYFMEHVSLVIDFSTIRGSVVYLISTQYIPQAVYP